jgi:hypothetical protein
VLLAVLLVLGLAACVSPIESEILRPETDFSKLKTFNWIDPADTPYAPAFAQRPLVDKRIRVTIDEEFVTSGYQRVEADQADFLITYHAAAADRVEFNPVAGAATVQAQPYIAVALMIDVYEARSKQLAWRGLNKQSFDNREAAIESIRKIVQQIVKQFVSDTSP